MKIFSSASKAAATKAVAFSLCATISLSIFGFTYSSNTQAADMLADIQAQKDANSQKIAELQDSIDDLESGQADQEEIQSQLNEKIKLQNDNITILMNQMDTLQTQIDSTQTEIDNLTVQIADQKVAIQNGLEQFKSRMLAMYVTGDDDLASLLVGTTDFYDILARVELISRVAQYDNELIDGLKTELEEYNANVESLNTKKADLEADMTDLESSKQECQTAIDALNEDMQSTQAEIDRLALEQQSQQQSIDEIKEANAALEAEEQSILDEIARQEEEAEARRQQELAEQQQQQQQQTSSDDSDSEETTPTNSDTSDYDGGTLQWPVPASHYISSTFGPRWGTNHKGIDIAAGNGSSIVAAESGTVVVVKTGCSHNYGKDSSCGCNGGYGNYVVISHNGTISTLYGHCSSVAVSVGDSVERGQTIAYVGSTGDSTGFHLHFETIVNGSRVDPLGYLNY